MEIFGLVLFAFGFVMVFNVNFDDTAGVLTAFSLMGIGVALML